MASVGMPCPPLARRVRRSAPKLCASSLEDNLHGPKCRDTDDDPLEVRGATYFKIDQPASFWV
eukprot:14705936-Alexandrium_andersonii.AAC.1